MPRGNYIASLLFNLPARTPVTVLPAEKQPASEPVYRDAETGQFLVPADQRVVDSKVLKTTALQGYALAEYRDGLNNDNDPNSLPWVEQYVAHFRNVIVPCYASLFANEVISILLCHHYYK